MATLTLLAQRQPLRVDVRGETVEVPERHALELDPAGGIVQMFDPDPPLWPTAMRSDTVHERLIERALEHEAAEQRLFVQLTDTSALEGDKVESLLRQVDELGRDVVVVVHGETAAAAAAAGGHVEHAR